MSLYDWCRMFFWFYVIFCVFIFIFAESNVWEPKIVEEVVGDIVFLRQEACMHWDRFFIYTKNIPRDVIYNLSAYFKYMHIF